MPGRPRLIVGRAEQLESSMPTSEDGDGLNVSYPIDDLSKLGWSFTVETAVRQKTKAKPYPFWDWQCSEDHGGVG